MNNGAAGAKSGVDSVTDEEEYEMAELESALWRVAPNTHTVPCEMNGYAEPDQFEGPGETYRAAYERLFAT